MAFLKFGRKSIGACFELMAECLGRCDGIPRTPLETKVVWQPTKPELAARIEFEHNNKMRQLDPGLI